MDEKIPHNAILRDFAAVRATACFWSECLTPLKIMQMIRKGQIEKFEILK